MPARPPVWWRTGQNAAEVSDMINRTRNKFDEPEQAEPFTPMEASALPPLQFKAWQQKDLTLITSPTFVYSDFYALGYTSLTVAQPKLGKSMLALAEAIDIATGRGVCKTTQAISPQTLLCANRTRQATS